MVTPHQLRRLGCFDWLQCIRKVYGSGHRFLNPKHFFRCRVTFNSNVVGHGRYICNLLHHDSGSQTVKYFNLVTKRLCANSVNRKCWSCGSSAPSFFCPSCKLVQPPEERTSYFEIMDWWEHVPFLLIFQGNLILVNGDYAEKQPNSASS